jgi:hypothetical protein
MPRHVATLKIFCRGLIYQAPTKNVIARSAATWQSHLAKYFMLLTHYLKVTIKKPKAPSPPKDGTPPRRGIIRFISSFSKRDLKELKKIES